MSLPKRTVTSIEEFIQHDADEQMDNASVSLLFSGQEIYIRGGQMDRDEWIEFGGEQVQAVSDCYNIQYHVFSASETCVTLMRD